MDSQPKAPNGDTPQRINPKSIDPRRRVYVPIEKRMLGENYEPGDWCFRTSDKMRYTRNKDTGVIRRVDPKPLNKKQRRALKERHAHN
jgi:hypothetical protein